MSVVIEVCGLVAVVIAGWRSYVLVREALAPLAHDGDPTRRAIEASRPLPMRTDVRQSVRRVILSLGWLIVASYGLYLVVAGQGLTR